MYIGKYVDSAGRMDATFTVSFEELNFLCSHKIRRVKTAEKSTNTTRSRAICPPETLPFSHTCNVNKAKYGTKEDNIQSKFIKCVNKATIVTSCYPDHNI